MKLFLAYFQPKMPLKNGKKMSVHLSLFMVFIRAVFYEFL